MPTRKEKVNEEGGPKEFLAKHWPAILTAAGVAGAAIYLTARYLLEKKAKSEEDRRELTILAEDGLRTKDDAIAFLEGGESLARTVGGEEASRAASELADHVEDSELAEGLRVYSSMTKPR